MTTVNCADITRGIQEAGLENSILALHSSLKSFGQVEGGPDTVVRAFLEAGCTLVVPTFTYECAVMRPVRAIPQNGWEPGWESADEPEDFSPAWNNITRDMGAIPASILKLPNRVRGRHPIDSISAIGPLAGEIIETQDFLNIFGPYEWMREHPQTYLLLMGVGFNRATPIHFAEELAGRRLFRRWGKYEGQIVENELGGCSEGFDRLRPTVQEIERAIVVGQSQWLIYPFREFVDKISEAISSNPELTRCEEPDCPRCRDAVKGGPILED